MRYIIIALIFSCFSLSVVAQSTTPRFGNTANSDQSSRVLNNNYVVLTDTTGADSAVVTLHAFNSLCKVALLDSFTLKSPTVTGCYLGDKLTLVVSGTSGDKLKFTGTNWVSTGTATLSSGVAAVISFIFNGAKWVESGRVVQ